MKRGISEHFAINLIGFQAIWWLAVLYREQGLIWIALLLTLHLFFHSDSRKELMTLLTAATLGFSVDSVLLHAGVFIFADHPLLPPLWLAALWLGFAATLNQSLKPLGNYPWLASLLGGLAGSASYLLGHKLGAVELGYSTVTTAITLFLIWALLLPLLLWISRSLNQWLGYPEEAL